MCPGVLERLGFMLRGSAARGWTTNAGPMLAELPTSPWFRRLLVAGLLLGIALLTFTVARPFIVPLIWGAILAYVAWPVHQRSLRLMRGRSGIAAILTTSLVTLALIVPLVWLIVLLRIEVGQA